MLETRHLLTFEAVVRTGTFAAAARELGYTQPGVSQQIRALERELNATLFRRAGRGLRLSEQGEVLAQRAVALLSQLKATEERITAVGRLWEGRVRVCAFPSANATLVPAAIKKMRKDHLGIEIELFEAEPPESIQGLSLGLYDVVVAFHYGESDVSEAEESVSVSLMQEPLLLLMPDSHRFVRRQQVPLSELSEERWVAGCARCRLEFLAACEEAGFSPRIDITTDDNLAVQSYVASGLGVAIMPWMVQSFVRHPKLRTRRVTPLRNREITANVLKSSRSSPAVEYMLDSLRWAADSLLIESG